MSKRLGDVQTAVLSPGWYEDLFRIGHLSDYLELTKPRVTVLVLITTLVGFYLASSGPLNYLIPVSYTHLTLPTIYSV